MEGLVVEVGVEGNAGEVVFVPSTSAPQDQMDPTVLLVHHELDRYTALFVAQNVG